MSKESSFPQRFNINIAQEDAQQRFVNRVYQGLFVPYMPIRSNNLEGIVWDIGLALGTYGKPTRNLNDIIKGDFLNCLRAIEAFYDHQRNSSIGMGKSANDIDKVVIRIIAEAEGDIGVEWHNGRFWPAGAKILDENLVNEQLKWLREKEHANIYQPFEKALRHYVESKKDPERLRDVITDMYEALEATAKHVNSNDKDLSSNAEKFVANLKLSDQHKEMLKAYIDYANKIARHAQSPKSKRIEVSNSEAENFIYLTGIFIRFAIQKLEEQGSPLMAHR